MGRRQVLDSLNRCHTPFMCRTSSDEEYPPLFLQMWYDCWLTWVRWWLRDEKHTSRKTNHNRQPNCESQHQSDT